MFELVTIAAAMYVFGLFSGIIAWTQFGSAWSTEKIDDKRRLKTVLVQLHQTAVQLLDNVNEHSVTLDGANTQIQHAIDSELDALEAVLMVISEVTAANNQMKKKLDEAKSTIQQQTQLLEVTATQARTDALTALANRRAFDEDLRAHFSSSEPVSVIILDIDHFKQFNDTHGHPAGDAVLRGVAQVLRMCVRKTDVAARYGGEEFALILAGASGEEAKKQAERIRAKIATSVFRCDNVDHEVTVSIGCAERLPGEPAASVLKRTDAALYAAKSAGRNSVRFHNNQQCVEVLASRPLPPKQVYRVLLPATCGNFADPE